MPDTIYGYSGGKITLDDAVKQIYSQLEDPSLENALNALAGLDIVVGFTDDMSLEEVEAFLDDFTLRYNTYAQTARERPTEAATPLGTALENNGLAPQIEAPQEESSD